MASPRDPDIVSGKRRPSGRHLLCTPEVMTEICDRIAVGEAMTDICKDEHLPDLRTVAYWLVWEGADDDPRVVFQKMHEKARTAACRIYEAEIMQIADDASDDLMVDPLTGFTRANNAAVSRDRLRVQARQWMLEKWTDRYADKKIIEGGDPDKPIRFEHGSEDVRELARRVAFLLTTADRAEAAKLIDGESEEGDD